jgi:hypothetical protein
MVWVGLSAEPSFTRHSPESYAPDNALRFIIFCDPYTDHNFFLGKAWGTRSIRAFVHEILGAAGPNFAFSVQDGADEAAG